MAGQASKQKTTGAEENARNPPCQKEMSNADVKELTATIDGPREQYQYYGWRGMEGRDGLCRHQYSYEWLGLEG